MISKGHKKNLKVLDPEARGAAAIRFESGIQSRVIGQDRAIRSITSLYQVFQAGMTNPTRPVGTLLFLGPTGSGKTHVVEAAAEVLTGDRNSVVKIDCAEFQHSHEIAKLIGSPPGYLGHRETSPLLTQENLDKYRTEEAPFTLVLFDEIEKASDALWQLLLGILDKGTLTLGDNRKVDFSQTIIVLTSNLGAKEMSELITGSIGFAPAKGTSLIENELDQKIYRTASEAARRKFSPEFMNRIDKVVVFRSLKDRELRLILDLELAGVQRRIDEGSGERFVFRVSEGAREFLLREGIEYRYGARHLKRAIERYLVTPLANLSATHQARLGDVVFVDFDANSDSLTFFRDEAEATLAVAALDAVVAMQTTGGGGDANRRAA
ncbi:MAG TPA: AAA family ATPase [Blastocatellia bacterium]|jgi:ATP-dependent Clp protease ATP-binding subunit ClpA|nr:AAA family ATPase [Blastocatellia bacterium]